MFPDNIKLTSGSLYLKDEFLTHNPPLVEIPDEPFPQYVKSFNLVDPKSAEFTLESEINSQMFKQRYLGMDLSNSHSFTAQFSEPYQVQRRKHKKKRINKKWAKRYGYVTKFRKWRINEVTMTGKNNFEFEATGRNIELISR